MVGAATVDWLVRCRWRLLAAAGNPPAAIAAHAGVAPSLVEQVVDAPATTIVGADGRGSGWWAQPWLHRRRFELQRCLDLLDRDAGPDGCWPTTGWVSSDGRAGRRSSWLGTSSLARQVLMLTSGMLDPPPHLVAAHRCHRPLCANPRCLVWTDRDGNAGHRRLQRLDIPIVGRPETQLEHLDVLDRPVQELDELRILEREVARLERDGTTGCLVRAGTARQGHYTTVHHAGRGHKLHRWLVAAAGADLDGRWVLHACDRPPCVALDHLSLGDPAANTADAIDRHRFPAGHRNGRASLTAIQLAELRRHPPTSPAARAQAAARLGCHPVTIDRAVRGHTYRNHPVPPRHEPVRRRLSSCGVVTVRTLIAAGIAPSVVATATGLSVSYLTDLAAGRQRPDEPGPITPGPGAARGRRVGTGVLTDLDRRLLRDQAAAGMSRRRLADRFGVGADAVGRALTDRTPHPSGS